MKIEKKYLIAFGILVGALLILSGCDPALVDKVKQASDEVKTTSSDVTVIPKPGRISLSWENTTEPHPERKEWSDFITKHMQTNINIYNQADDIMVFCPKFKTLNDPPKVKALGEIIVGITYFESGYKPTSWMSEKEMIDPKTGKQIVDTVTGQPVKSEGLMQLSYQDIPNYGAIVKGCGIDWSKDKGLSQDDKKKTIFNPIINLDCGLRILTNQVKNRKAITVEKGVYWAVIRRNGKYTHIPEIAARVQKNAPECK